MKLAAQILGALALLGAVIATGMGQWAAVGLPLAFVGAFWFFIFPRSEQSRPPEGGPEGERMRKGYGFWWKIAWVLLLIGLAYWFRSTR